MPIVRLTATLAMPIVLTDDLHLDGLLAAVHPLCQRHPISRATPVDALIRPPLPIATVTARGHAVMLGTVAQFPDDARLTTDYATKRRDGSDVEAFARKVNSKAGPDKDRMIQLPLVVAREVWWDAVGLRKPILTLARRIHAIGAWRGQGYGHVLSWRADKLDDPARVVLQRGGRLQRHVPAAWAPDAPPVQGAYEPPYWHPARLSQDILRAGSRAAIAEDILALADAMGTPEQLRAHRERHEARREARRAALVAGGA
jgi:hypothetical protein